MEKTLKEEYCSEGITYRSMIDFLNWFYSTAQYRVIPIDNALKWFYLSANGKMTVNQLDDYATGRLKFYTENSPEMT